MTALETAATLSAAIASIGIVLETAEVLAGWRPVLERAFAWPLIESRYYVLIRHPRIKRALRACYSGRWTLRALVVLHAVAAAAYAILLPTAHLAAAGCAAVVLVVHLLLHFRFLVGLDGADQMQTVMWAGLLVFAASEDEALQLVSAGFIVAQLLLSYIVAGTAKAVSPTWRSGQAVSSIVRTASYGASGAREVLMRPLPSFTACWMTIAFEVGAVLMFLVGGPALVLLVLSGILFHVGIALVMGLQAFVWSFLGAYPLLWVIGERVGLL